MEDSTRAGGQHLPAMSLKIVSKLPNGLQVDSRLLLIFGTMLLAMMLAVYWITNPIARQIYLTKITGDAGSVSTTTMQKIKTNSGRSALMKKKKRRPGRFSAAPAKGISRPLIILRTR